MTSGEWPSINPYQAPAEVPLTAAEFTPEDDLRQKLVAFRQQIHAIGGAWMLFGVLLMSLGSEFSIGGASYRDARGIVHGRNVVALIAGNVIVVFGLVWIGAGIFACLKKLSAVYLGLGISYLLLGALVLSLPVIVGNIIPAVLNVIVIRQTHRVMRWAKELTAAGIPLNAKP